MSPVPPRPKSRACAGTTASRPCRHRKTARRRTATTRRAEQPRSCRSPRCENDYATMPRTARRSASASNSPNVDGTPPCPRQPVARGCRSSPHAAWRPPMLFSAGGPTGFRSRDRTSASRRITMALSSRLARARGPMHCASLPPVGSPRPLLRLATWQPVPYGTGQLLHSVGRVWSAGYSVRRTVARAEEVLRTRSEVCCMVPMSASGLIAAIGGLAFARVVVHTLRRGWA